MLGLTANAKAVGSGRWNSGRRRGAGSPGRQRLISFRVFGRRARPPRPSRTCPAPCSLDSVLWNTTASHTLYSFKEASIYRLRVSLQVTTRFDHSSQFCCTDLRLP